MPNEMLPSCMAAPTLAANIIMENVGKGMPLFRLEDSFTRDGLCIDRASMARWKKLVGEGLASTVVRAMHLHALATAFCISTDADSPLATHAALRFEQLASEPVVNLDARKEPGLWRLGKAM